MSLIIREPAELMALPVGTEAVDREGDYLRRSSLGWTYRPAGLPVHPDDIAQPRLLSQYMPMVVTTVSTPSSPLDSPRLPLIIRDYLVQELMHPNPDSTPDPYMDAALDIIRIAKEHDL